MSMSHLAYPPLTPASPLPHPRDQTQARLSSQNLTMYAESARIQKVMTIILLFTRSCLKSSIKHWNLKYVILIN